jgi:hypothetical protein
MLWVVSLCAGPGLYSMWWDYCLRREWQFLLRRTCMRPRTAVRPIWWQFRLSIVSEDNGLDL